MFTVLAMACTGFDIGVGDPDVIVPDPVWVDETLLQDAPPAVDVLFVVDGTGSMAEEQAALGAAAVSFVSALDGPGLDWQLGAVSTDLAEAGVLHGDPWIVTPNAAAPGEALTQALAVGSDHVPPSCGLDAATLALRDSTGQNLGFRRENAALHVVFVSDGDDQSGTVLGADPVGTFVDLLAGVSARSGQPARASAVVGDAPHGCTGATGTANAGTRYLDVAARSGGAVSSLCDVDFAAVAARIGELAAAWPTRFSLQAEPAPGSVTVTVDGEREADFTVDYDDPSVEFAEAPAPDSTILVHYRLAGGA